MKHLNNTILCLIEGGNKYKVVDKRPTKSSEFKGLYQIECIDFWYPEEICEGVTCWKEGEKVWVDSFQVDFMVIWQDAEDFNEKGLI